MIRLRITMFRRNFRWLHADADVRVIEIDLEPGEVYIPELGWTMTGIEIAEE